MAVIHILKDGTVKDDITGHVVKLDDPELLYRLLENISEKKTRRGKKK